jgi:hypothetical protein
MFDRNHTPNAIAASLATKIRRNSSSLITILIGASAIRNHRNPNKKKARPNSDRSFLRNISTPITLRLAATHAHFPWSLPAVSIPPAPPEISNRQLLVRSEFAATHTKQTSKNISNRHISEGGCKFCVPQPRSVRRRRPTPSQPIQERFVPPRFDRPCCLPYNEFRAVSLANQKFASIAPIGSAKNNV